MTYLHIVIFLYFFMIRYNTYSQDKQCKFVKYAKKKKTKLRLYEEIFNKIYLHCTVIITNTLVVVWKVNKRIMCVPTCVYTNTIGWLKQNTDRHQVIRVQKQFKSDFRTFLRLKCFYNWKSHKMLNHFTNKYCLYTKYLKTFQIQTFKH